AEHGPDGDSTLVTTSSRVAEEVLALTNGRVRIQTVESLADAVRRANELAPEHVELLVADPHALAGEIRNAGAVFLGTTAVLGDYAAGSNHVLPTGGLARDASRARRRARDGPGVRRARGPAPARRSGGCAVNARPLPEGFEPYAWAPAQPPHVIRFDANTPPLPGVPQVPLGESFARLNDYPEGTYRDLREAAAEY